MKLLIKGLTLPYPPSVNHYWGMRGKIRFLTAKAKKFRQEVVRIVEELGLDNDIDSSLRLEMKVYPPDRRKRDVDNTIKPVLDALEHANLYTNDVNVTTIEVTKRPFDGKHNARAEITVYELSNE